MFLNLYLCVGEITLILDKLYDEVGSPKYVFTLLHKATHLRFTSKIVVTTPFNYLII